MSCGKPVVDLRARRVDCANRIAPLPTLHPGPRSGKDRLGNHEYTRIKSYRSDTQKHLCRLVFIRDLKFRSADPPNGFQWQEAALQERSLSDRRLRHRGPEHTRSW